MGWLKDSTVEGLGGQPQGAGPPPPSRTANYAKTEEEPQTEPSIFEAIDKGFENVHGGYSKNDDGFDGYGQIDSD